MSIFSSLCTKCNSKWLLKRDRDHAKKPSVWKENGIETENRIAFEVLSALRLL